MRQDNKEMLNDTLAILQRGCYNVDGKRVKLKLTREQMTELSVYLPEDIRRIEADTDFQHVHVIGRVGVAVRISTHTRLRGNALNLPIFSFQRVICRYWC